MGGTSGAELQGNQEPVGAGFQTPIWSRGSSHIPTSLPEYPITLILRLFSMCMWWNNLPTDFTGMMCF